MSQEQATWTTPQSVGKTWYLPFMILLSGLGGLLAGIDYGIIAAALLYLDKTIPMTPAEQGLMVSIYMIGGIIASLFAGALADIFGRKKIMILAGIMFIGSILTIFAAQGYIPLLVGRVLMGLSGGIVCVVIPLYMAECLPSAVRGRGTAAFQFLLVFGLFISTFIGDHFAGVREAAVADANGNPALIFQADDAAWRNIFLTACVPGALFIFFSLLVKESPRWLFRRRREDEASTILRYSRTEEQAALEMQEMKDRAALATVVEAGQEPTHQDSLLQRKYILPFIIACIVLACTQATGVNTILSFGAKILQGSGLTEKDAAFNLQIVTGINVAVTLLGALLVDRLGRKILLTIGTGGIVLCLFAAGILFNNFESKRVDVLSQVQKGLAADGTSLAIHVDDATLAKLEDGRPGQLTVAYQFEKESKPRVTSQFSNQIRTLGIRTPLVKGTETVDGKTVEYRYVKDIGRLEIRTATATIAGLDTPVDITDLVRKSISSDGRAVTVAADIKTLEKVAKEKEAAAAAALAAAPKDATCTVTVTYKYEQGAEQTATVSSTDPIMLAIAHDETLKWEEKNGKQVEVMRVTDLGKLSLAKASYGPIADASTGKWVTMIICCFMGFFAIGPGVCVWLALTELMPTRIRSTGIGVAMVLNNGVQFCSALFFPIVAGSIGFHLMFFIWGGCTVLYFATAAFLMPETKGKTLEEIEDHFAGKSKAHAK